MTGERLLLLLLLPEEGGVGGEVENGAGINRILKLNTVEVTRGV